MRDRTHKHLSEKLLERLVDRDLRAAEAEAAERHLATCVRCRGRLEAWERFFARLGALPELHPAPGFSERVMVRIAAAKAQAMAPARAAWTPALAWARRLWPVAAAAALFWTATFGGAVAWWTRSSEMGLGDLLTWGVARLQDVFWTGLVRVAGAVNLSAVDLNVGGLVLFVAFLTLFAFWGARVLVRYTTPMTKVRIYA